MSMLRRNARPLLTTVNRKRHATEDDHEESERPRRKSPKVNIEQDSYRPPDSSSDAEESSVVDVPVVSSAGNAAASSATSLDPEPDTSIAKPSRRPVPRQSSRSTYGKGKPMTATAAASPASGAANDSDDDMFGEMGGHSKHASRGSSYSKRAKTANVNLRLGQKQGKVDKRNPIGNKASNSTFKSPAQLVDKPLTPSTSTGFVLPKQAEPHKQSSKATDKSVSSFKAIPDLPTATENRRAPTTRSLRSNANQAHENGSEHSKFKQIAGLGDNDTSNFKKSAEELGFRLNLADVQDPVVHPSQLDPDKPEADIDEALEDIQDEENKIVCPYCHDTISDAELIRRLRSSKHMNMSKQATFCRSHRRAEGLREWKERGYPDIEWDQLPRRVAKLSDHATWLIHNERNSIYRDRLAEKISSGSYRSMLQALNNDASSMNSFIPGYYGGKGAKIIANQLMSTFSEEIRKRAGQDKVIGAAGAGGFVQAVLVPEIAVNLIMDDLAVGEDEAGVIVEESADLGDLLFEEDDEEKANMRKA